LVGELVGLVVWLESIMAGCLDLWQWENNWLAVGWLGGLNRMDGLKLVEY